MERIYRDPASSLVVDEAGQIKGKFDDKIKDFRIDIKEGAYSKAMEAALKQYLQQQELVEQEKRERTLEDLRSASEMMKARGSSAVDFTPFMQHMDTITGSNQASRYKRPTGAEDAAAQAQLLANQGRAGQEQIDALRMAGAKLPVDAAGTELKASMGMDANLAGKFMQLKASMDKADKEAVQKPGKPFEVSLVNKLSGYKSVMSTVQEALNDLVPLKSKLGVAGQVTSGAFLGPQITKGLSNIFSKDSKIPLLKKGSGFFGKMAENALAVEKFKQMTELFKRKIMREIEGGRLTDADAIAYNRILGSSWSDPEAFYNILLEMGDRASNTYSDLYDTARDSGRDPRQLAPEISYKVPTIAGDKKETRSKGKTTKSEAITLPEIEITAKKSFDDLYKASKKK